MNQSFCFRGFFTLCLLSMTISVWGQVPNRPAQQQRPMTPQQRGTAQRSVPVPSALPSQRLASPRATQRIAAAKTSCALISARKPGNVDLVEILLEAGGKIFSEDEKSDPKGNKLEIVAGFRFEERTQTYGFDSKSPLASLRLYEQAGMKRQFKGETDRPLLDVSRKYIECLFDGQKLTRFSPAGPLKNDQFLLLEELPFDPLLLDRLLPNKTVKTGEEWGVSDELITALTGLEDVQNNTLRLVLSAIIDDIAEVDLYLDGGKDKAGKPLPGSIEGVSSGGSVTMDIQGKFQFDLKKNRMTWFGVKIDEIRGGNLLEPRMEISAMIRLKIAPINGQEKLTEQAASELDIKPTPDKLQLTYHEQTGPWQFQFSRQWRMIEDNEKSAALCLVHHGEGVAQCNILLGDKVDPKTMSSLDVYQKELQKGLGDRFGQFVSAQEYQDESKYIIYSVVIDGQMEEVGFRWLYYLLTAPDGRQVTLMFEIKADMIEQFGNAGEEIIRSFRLN